MLKLQANVLDNCCFRCSEFTATIFHLLPPLLVYSCPTSKGYGQCGFPLSHLCCFLRLASCLFFFFCPTREGTAKSVAVIFCNTRDAFKAQSLSCCFSLILLGVSFVHPFTGRLGSENRLQPKVPLLYSLLYSIFHTSLTTTSGFRFGFLNWLKRPSRDKKSLTATDGNREQSQPLHR